MGSLALDAREDRAGARAPISQHPVFAALVAAWFAALLGIGCLILPAILLERLVEATGIASLVPAAGPPLSSPVRGAVAFAAALAGASLGLLIARQVTRAHAAAIDEDAATPFGRRPISAHDELGDEGLGGEDAGPKARRGLIADFVSEAFDPAPVVQEPLDLTEEYAEPAIKAGPATAIPRLAEVPAPADEPASSEWETAPLESLGTVQLVQRLGASLEKRRALRSEAALPVAPADFAAAPAEETAQAMAAYFARPAAPAAVRAVPDPAPAYASPAAADDALRRALATLQRMSSAG